MSMLSELSTNNTTTTSQSGSMSPLSRRYKNLYQSQKYVDCSFIIAQTTIKCHKLILSSASPVFEAMLYGPIREEKSVEILDISPDVFSQMINYIYTGEIDFDQQSLENTIELYYSAEKYLLTDLVAVSLNAIKSKLRFENILQALDLSVCMNLKGLLHVCLSFFAQFCLNDIQFMKFLKTNYFHVSKDCIKTVIASNRNLKYVIWFVREWCYNECEELGLSETQYKLVTNDLEINPSFQDYRIEDVDKSTGYSLFCKYIERTYYRACRPFVVTHMDKEFTVVMLTKQFVTLLGVTINSRLMPSFVLRENDYLESLQLEISSKSENLLLHRQVVDKQATHYNSNLDISWEKNVILLPDVEYSIKFIWNDYSIGAEYPSSLMSNEVDGIQIKDLANNTSGSIFKGFKYLNLIS